MHDFNDDFKGWIVEILIGWYGVITLAITLLSQFPPSRMHGTKPKPRTYTRWPKVELRHIAMQSKAAKVACNVYTCLYCNHDSGSKVGLTPGR